MRAFSYKKSEWKILSLCLIAGILLAVYPSVVWAVAYPFSDDMETAGNWNADSPWNITTSDSHSSAAAWTDSSAYYGNEADVSLTLSSGIDLSASSNPQLVFWHKYEIETDFDFGYVEVSDDGGTTWNPVPLASYTGISGWTREQIGLASYKAEANLLIRFRLKTDKTIVWDGWTIDDVSISEPPNAVASLVVDNPTSTSLDLTWSKNLDTDFSAYKIYRSLTADVSASSTPVATITDPAVLTYSDSNLIPETSYFYKVYVFDTDDLAAGSTVESGTTNAAEFAYPFFDDLEELSSAWSAETPWGIADEIRNEATSKVWSDSPGGSYAAGEDSSLQMTIDLGSATMPVLSFWHKYTINTDSDYVYVEVQEDGSITWKRIYFATGTQASWIQERVDLSDYAGKKMHIRFRLVSDSNGIQSNGWLLDDVKIDETARSALSFPFFDDLDSEMSADNWHSSSWALVSPGNSGTSAFSDSPAELDALYGALTDSSLIMANSIDLTNAIHPLLTFWHKYDTKNSTDNGSGGAGCGAYWADEYDYARVYLSTDNGQPGTWTKIAEFKGSQTTWGKQQIDLSDWAGLPNVRIKFVMNDNNGNDGDCTRRLDGWSIDDIVIEDAPAEVSLLIDASSMHGVSLSWTQNLDDDFDHYEIYRSSTPDVTRGHTLVAAISTQATITYEDIVAMVQPGTYYYRAWVVDTSGDFSWQSNEVHAVFTVPENTYPFSDDGEEGTGKWSWGTPWGLVSLPPEQSHTGSASSVWTDSPGANYPANANTSLTTFMDLSSASTPVLTFWHRYSFEEGVDFLNLEASVNGGDTWTTLRTFTGTETTWNRERIDLVAYAGNAKLGLRFRLTSDGDSQQDGWYMDSLTIVDESIQAAYPFFDDMEDSLIPWFYDTPWEVAALPASESHSGIASVVWTDSPEGSYGAGEDTWLTMTIDLGSAEMPVLSFWQKYAFESNSDHGYTEIREVGGSSWKRVYFVTGTMAWFQERIDLTNYAGKQINLRFRVVADTNGTQSDGWYIDDIKIDETEKDSLVYPFFDNIDNSATITNWHSSSWALVADPHSDNYAFTDSSEGDYGALVDSVLIMANSIDLGGATHPQLTFWHKYETKNSTDNGSGGAGCGAYWADEYDFGRVYLSTGKGQPGTWTQLAAFKGSQSTWVYTQIDLSDWAGLPNIRFKFVMNDNNGNDGDCTRRLAGWTIDDVILEEAPVDVALSIEASSMNNVVLSWSRNSDADFDRYEIYRSSSPDVTRSNTLITTITSQTEISHSDAIALVQPNTYYYRMWVYDLDGNVSLGSNEVVVTYSVPRNSYPFTEDGESGADRWAWGSPWGLVTLDAAETYSGAISTVWTDSPGANYGADANTSLTAFVNLSGTSTPVLTFWHRYSLDEGNDFIGIEVSTDDGQNWTTLRSITGTETSWNRERIDLSAYAGNANLGVRFRLTSNGTSQQDGWYMDDLQIEEEAVQANYPFFDNMESGIIPWFYGSPWGLKTLDAAESYSGSATVVWTDSPVGSYSGGADASLQVTVDLGAANMPVLVFWQKYALETNSDHGYIEIKEVGTSIWKRLYFVTGTSPAWVMEKLDLSNYAGKQVSIRFRIVTDSNGIQSDGWYIDDISIDETPTAFVPYPFADDMDTGGTEDNWHSSSWELIPDSNSGTYAFTDSPEGNYGSLVDSSLITAGHISLRGAVRPQLTFWHKYDTKNSTDNGSGGAGCGAYWADEYDYGRVYLSTYNGQPGTWTQLAAFKGTQSEWTQSNLDLSSWIGLPNVRIKFVMNDNYGNDGACSRTLGGWTIDDVRIGEDESIPSYIQKMSGDGQTGQTGTALEETFTAKIYDADSNPRSGILIIFDVIAGGGVFPGDVTSITETSDANGWVSTVLTLGADSGNNSVSATVDGSEPLQSVTFSATGFAAGQAKNLEGVSGDNQINEINLALTNPLRVRVTDILDAPVADVSVTFSINSGSGTLEVPDSVVTDADGYASNNLTLGASTGTTVVAVSSSGLIPVLFRAHAVLTGGTLGDDDGDGMPNEWEDGHDLNSQDASDGAGDGDGDDLSNFQEYARGTNPNDNDSDHDGMDDGWEVQFGLDPTDPSDASDDNDNDDVANRQEFLDGTTPIYPKHYSVGDATNESMDFYGLVTIDDIPAQVGDEVAVFDPDGVICGTFRISQEGEYGFMHVYKDDSGTTGVDEGAEPGDELTFRVWDASAGVELEAAPDVNTGTNPPTWTADRDSAYVNLNGAGEQVIPLQIGWNLISFSIKTDYYIEDVPGEGPPDVPMLTGTVHLNVVNIADVFESIDGLYDVIRSFDKNGAHTFDPALPSFSDMKYVAGGYGYWIKMNAAGNLILRGVRAKSTDSLSLHPGWNLIGYWHPAVQHTGSMPTTDFPIGTTQFISIGDIDEAIAEISGNYFVIRSYDIDGAHTYDPMLGSFNDLDYLGAGYGIWIKMKTVDILSYE